MSTGAQPIKFNEKITASDFGRTLSRRIEDYFEEGGITRFANGQMVLKTVLGFGAWIATYAWLISDTLPAWGVVGVFVLHGFAQLFMGLNIAHDAVHGAYAPSRRVNRLLGCVFDLVGLSSYMWRLMHNHSHHFFVNIDGADTAMTTNKIFRFSPRQERHPFHRYQHLYASFVYSLATLEWVLAKDFRWLRHGRFGNRSVTQHPRSSVCFLIGAKLFYYTYMLILPLTVLSVPWYAVIGGFVLMHLLLGFSLALTFQPNHFTEDSGFPAPDESGKISNNYIQHIFENTTDYARGNPLANWCLGGLNLHVVHHMFPQVCHVHYPALTEILKASAEEFGIPYRENRTVIGAYRSHLRWLRILGAAEA